MALIAVLIVLLPAVDDRANDVDVVLHDAETAFQAGLDSRAFPEQARSHFLRAEQLYAQLRDEGVNTPTLYRNLGNAALLAGDLPQAILAYRQGLAADPGDPVLQASLQYARTRVDSTDGFKQAGDGFFFRFHGWTFPTAYLLYVPGWFFLARWWRSRLPGNLYMGLGCLATSLILLAGVWIYDSKVHKPVAVITQDETYLRKGNGFAYPRLEERPLAQGAEAEVLASRNGWLKIELASGVTGWIPEKAAIQ